MTIAFDVVFGLFAVAIVALAVIAVRWAVRRDRVARTLQAERAREATPPAPPRVAPGSTPEGRSS
jgi:heme exporter protein D